MASPLNAVLIVINVFIKLSPIFIAVLFKASQHLSIESLSPQKSDPDKCSQPFDDASIIKQLLHSAEMPPFSNL